jgi:hypothetical protein
LQEIPNFKAGSKNELFPIPIEEIQFDKLGTKYWIIKINGLRYENFKIIVSLIVAALVLSCSSENDLIDRFKTQNHILL